MKTFGNVLKKSVFTVLILVWFLQGVTTSIYVYGAEEKTAVEKETITVIKIILPDGTVGKEYKESIKKRSELEDEALKWLIDEKTVPKDFPFTLNAESGELVGVPKSKGVYHFKIRAWKSEDDKMQNLQTLDVSLKIKPEPKKVDYELTERFRLIGGYEMVRATSASGKEKFFVDLYLSQPFPLKFKNDEHSIDFPLRFWGNVRLSSAPQPKEKPIKEVDQNALSELADLSLSQITTSAEVLLGLELRLRTWGNEKSKYKNTFSFIIATGAVKPFSATEDNPQIFKIPEDPEDFKKKYPGENIEGKDYVTFVLPERNRFYKQFYMGFRLKTYEKKNNGLPLPYVFDMTWGVNEAASGDEGHLFRKSVFRLDGFLPLPFKLPILKLPVYIFGTLVVNTSKEKVEPPLSLEPVTDVQAYSPGVLKVFRQDNDRDYFRIGLGINLANLFSTDKNKNSDKKN